MKSTIAYLSVAILVLGLASCSKSGNDSTKITTPTVPSSNPIAPGNVTGFVKGTFTTGNTYTITGDLTIKAGDTLASQQGVTVIVANNAQITVFGVLNLVGTQASPIEFNSSSKLPGSWGGFAADSAQAITIKWTHIDNTGGPDPTGKTRETISVDLPINVDVEDSWITNGQDNGLGIENGAKITILRNTFLCSGSTDGEAIDIKKGVTGTIAYNVIYSQAGSAIKIETDDVVPIPQTVVDVYNNTLVSNGWRRGAAEPGRGVSIDLNARANIYNNIMVNNYQGLEIFTGADIVNTKYGNNLFYASVDSYVDTTAAGGNAPISIRSNFYPGDGVGKSQASDLISTKVGDKDPLFKSYDGKVATPNGAVTSNDFHLNTGSPAIGKGNSTYNSDIGAYTSDGQGNKH